jgi:serine/threonine protein kinase
MSLQQTYVAERYRLIEALGSGGMGRVWLARDEVLRRDVAIKEVVPPEGLTAAEREELRLRTMREARAAARLNDPHVVRIYDVITAGQRPWIVMEYVPSRSLHQVITEDGPLPHDRVAHIGLAVLGALRAAHDAGVLHRDVKPGNVLLADSGRVVLTDFGLATFEGGDGAVTRPGLILGSPQYISPERARDGRSGPESDLWSLGATLYAAVEGRSPYARETTYATLTALATEEPEPPTNAGPLKPVINALLRKDPRSRAGIAETERLLLRAAANEGRAWPWSMPRQRRSREGNSGSLRGLSSPSGGRSLQSNSRGSAGFDAKAANGAPGGPPGASGLSGPALSLPVPGRPTFPGRARGNAAVPAGGLVPVPDPSLPVSALPGAGIVVSRAGSDLVRLRRDVLASPPRQRWRWLVVASSVIVVALVAGVLLTNSVRDRQRLGDQGDNQAAGAPAAPGASTSTSARSPEVYGSIGDDRVRLPPGFGYYTDPTHGWTIAVPDGWVEFTDPDHPTMSMFADPTSHTLVLGVDRDPRPGPSPAAAFTADEEQLVNAGSLPGYKKIKIAPVRFLDKPGASWEYTYAGTVGPRHVIDTNFTVNPALGCGIYWATPVDTWAANLGTYNLIAVSFRPGN